MIARLALRSLLARPVRSAVLAGGFGLGVAVMAALLGIGGVILEQSRDPALAGGGDVVLGGVAGRLTSPRFVMGDVLGAGPLAPQVAAASPWRRADLYLFDAAGTTPVRARGGIPSRERAIGDPETSGISGWTDTEADRGWAAPDPEDVLRDLDRFHPIPDVPARAGSWAEWLYFNGRAGDARFYLTFLAGPRLPSGGRSLGVRLQLERNGRMTSYSSSVETDESEIVASAPDLTAGPNRVRLSENQYRLTLDLPAERGGGRVQGTLVVTAQPGKAAAPLVLRGANGWLSGYVVPVMAGALEGTLTAGGERVDFSGGTAYHDHNWGFWEGVRWQWGQVQGPGLSFVYGRVFPPPDAADPDRIPGFLVALGENGPIGFATDVTIEETDRPGGSVPERILVRGRGDNLDVTMDLAIEQETSTRMGERSFGGGMTFLQLRAVYRVSGRAGGRAVTFTAPGSAETFRGGHEPGAGAASPQ